ncbi:DUF6998 domain-containing protein [Frigoribacterium sp. CFBP9030]|uniref:DUF6998 domain-containing protein n=1 Tax=Frigoribacterium sp. CFBP9030 TaxID=3096537 RepID=UPI002A6B4E26|nr:hypothetical protein [Frigoribacterium sp. CFBP9030]MDY0891653.1 hypothetical protein [Frigoribacterium sp. CFBP9030]
MSDTRSVPELAAQIGADQKEMRRWMRERGWRHPIEKGQPWSLTGEQVAILTARFGETRSIHSPEHLETTEPTSPPFLSSEGMAGATPPDAMPLARLSVGELLDTYSQVLLELRARNLVRTNNAPVGDLAEYCAAMVYDGLLAPNSEKSYDLTSVEGRKVQVKVRLIRPGMASGAVFSPVRSFDFDTCAFIVIDNEAGRVIAAREWTPVEVREHGSYKKHTNGTVVTVAQVRSSKARGRDRTADFDAAWGAMLSQTR